MVLTVPPLTTKESQHQGTVVNHPDAPFLIGIHGESWADDFAEISFLEDSGLLMLPRCASAFLKIRVGQGADQPNTRGRLLFSEDDLCGPNVNPLRPAGYECGVAGTVAFSDMICQKRDSLFFVQFSFSGRCPIKLHLCKRFSASIPFPHPMNIPPKA